MSSTAARPASNAVQIQEIEVVLAKPVARLAAPVLELKTATSTVRKHFKPGETTLRWVLEGKPLIDEQSWASLGLLRTHRIRQEDELKLKREWPLPFHEMANRNPANPYIVQTHNPVITIHFDHKSTQIPVSSAPVPAPTIVEEERMKARTAISNMKTLGSPIESVVSAVDSADGRVSLFLDTLSKFNSKVSEIATIHPYARAAWTILSVPSKLIIDQVNRDESIRSLFLKMEEVYMFLTTEEELRRTKFMHMKTVVERITHQTQECSYFIREYSKNEKFRTRFAKNLLSGTDDRVKKFNGVFDKLMQDFRDGATRDTSVVVHWIWDRFEELSDDLDLNNMQYAADAGLNTQKLCLEGTRSEILDEITEWINDDDEDAPRIFCLHGTAGSGKSAIAHTIADRFKTSKRLGSFFCFDRNRAADWRHEKIFSTIAKDLADRDPQLRKVLAAAVHHKTSLRNTPDILQQWEELIVQPAKAMSDAMTGPIVIVIDAFDESGNADSRRDILRILSGKAHARNLTIMNLPRHFRILLTSRPLPDVVGAFKDAVHVRQKSMDTIPSTKLDVKRYISDQLSEVELGPDLELPTISADLARKSDGLFEWARLACEYVMGENGMGAGLNVKGRFRSIMARSEALLDGMYRLILGEMFPGEERERRRSINCFKSVMAQILGTMEPLPLTSLEEMRHHFVVDSEVDPRSIVIHMGALLGGTTDSSVPIRALHASFPDFLVDRDRSGEFFIDVLPVEENLSISCLLVMEKELQFNICQMPSSYLPNSKVPDLNDRIKEYISPELAYSCRFWIAHVCNMPFRASVANVICKLFSDKELLFWFEVLSLLKSINTCAGSLSSLIHWIKDQEKYKEIVDYAADAQKFLRLFSGIISFSTPHLYLSALPFSPKNSGISKRFADKFHHSAKIISDHNGMWSVLLGELHGHSSQVYSVAFSLDGKYIVSGSSDKTIRLWDAETGEPLLAPLEGHQGSVLSVAFSSDGKHIVSGSEDKTVQLWDTETGKPLQAPLEGHQGPISSVAFSPGGKHIVSGSHDTTIGLWDVETGEQLQAPLEGHQSSVFSVAFSPDGKCIVSGSDDKTIRLWDAETGEPLQTPLEGHQGSVLSVAFSPDGKCIASGSQDSTIQLWDAKTGEPLQAPLKRHDTSISSVAFSSDGKHIVSGSFRSVIVLWDVETGEPLRALDLNRSSLAVLSVAFSPDGKRVASGSYDKIIRLWDASEMVQAPLEGHQSSVFSVAFSPDGGSIVSGSFDNTIQLWDTKTGEQLQEPLEGHQGWVLSVAFSPDGKHIVSGSSDKTIQLWDAKTGESLLAPLKGHHGPVWSVAFSPDGKCIVSGSNEGEIQLWDAETGELLQTPLKGHHDQGQVWSVAFSPDGKHIASGSNEGTIQLWDAKTGEPLQVVPLKGHSSLITSVAFSPDGKHIVSGSFDTRIHLWDAETGKPLGAPLCGHKDSVVSVAFSPDGKHIVSGSFDKTIQLWDAKTGEPLGAPLEGQNSVRSVAFSPDGKYVVSVSTRENTIRFWDKADINPVSVPTFSSCKEHALHDPVGLFCHTKINKQGWFTGHDGELLFWVPPDLRPTFFMPGNKMVIPRGVELDVSHMAHGDEWYKVKNID